MSLSRQVLTLAIWPWLEQLLAFSVGTVDLALAGHLDPPSLQVAATDALGATTYITWLMAMIHSAVGVGTAALIARAVGGRHRRLANAAVGQSLVLATLMGSVVGLFIFMISPWAGSLLAGLRGPSQQLSSLYLRIVALAAPASAVLLVGGAGLRGAGDTRTPFIVMLVVNLVNITTSILFVYAPAPLGHHGVSGIAAGTVVAWLVGAVLIVAVLRRGNGGTRLYPHRLRPHAHTLQRITRVGMPALLESVIGMWVANALVLRIVGSLQTQGVVGAHMIAIRAESLSFLSGYALGTAASTLTGQYLGSGDPHNAKKAAVIAWAYGSAIMGTMGLFFFAIPQHLARVITDAPVLLNLSVTPIRICGPIQVFFATQIILAGALRGAGDTRATMWMTTLSNFLIRLPAAYVMGIVLDLGLTGVWLALCGELVIRGLIFATRFLRGQWTQIQI